VIVTHEPQAAAIADRVLNLEDGRLTGTRAEPRRTRLGAA
jgi:ABC-type lipoprotein export system ATPase subunit